MCLSIPVKLIEKNGNAGKADAGGNLIDVRLDLVSDALPGDYILVHAGFAIQKYDEADALETLRLLKESVGGTSQAF
jgi:hydrogenase expression/formation protein HypC